MLGKILKYELKATAGTYLLMFAALLLVACVTMLLLPTSSFSGNSVQGTAYPAAAYSIMQMVYSFAVSLSTFAYVVLLAGNLLIVVVISIVRFYQMHGDQGYLWFTLPATASTHIAGKLIASLIWFIASLIVVTISIGLLMAKTGWWEYIPSFLETLVLSNINVGLWAVVIPVTCVITYLANIIMFYTAIAIGPNITKSRLGGTVIAYIIIYVAEQALSAVLLIPVAILLGNQYEALFALSDASINTISQAFVSPIEIISLTVIGFSCLFAIVLSVVLCVIMRHCMTKRLNLT